MASSLAHGSTGLLGATLGTGIEFPITNPVLLDVGVEASFGGDGCVEVVVSCGTGKMLSEECTAPGVGGRLFVVFNDSAKARARSSSS